MQLLTRFKWFLWYFGHFQVPLIGHLKPRIIELSDARLVIKLALNRRSRNHLHSMYFGALAVGADLAGGLYSFYHARRLNCVIAPVFKSFQAEFLQRPESDVYFVCTKGDEVRSMVIECQETKQRVTRMIEIKAYTQYMSEAAELVAQFQLELSLKCVAS